VPSEKITIFFAIAYSRLSAGIIYIRSCTGRKDREADRSINPVEKEAFAVSLS
jgi:hypothetical protein